MPFRFLLLLPFVLLACDTGGPSPDDARPSVPLEIGRFDGDTASDVHDYGLRLYLEEDVLTSSRARVEGTGGAVRLGSTTFTVDATYGRRDGDEVTFTAVFRSGGSASFSGEVRDDGRTLIGMLSAETQAASYDQTGIVLRWQDLNY